MNKQLTKKTIGIAASAALMASVAFSGSALAAKGGNSQSPTKGSIGVTNTCEVTVNPYDKSDVVLELTSVIVDKSSGNGEALDVEWSAQAQEKYRGRDLYPIGEVKTAFFAGIPEVDGVKTVTVVETFDLCDAGIYDPTSPGMSTYAKAANAQTVVMIKDGHREEGWISRCVDPDSDDGIDQLASLKLEQGLCPDNTDRQDD